jgi:hypothetical protein
MKKKPVVGKGLLAAPLLVGSDKNEQQHHSVPARGVGGFQKNPKTQGGLRPLSLHSQYRCNGGRSLVLREARLYDRHGFLCGVKSIFRVLPRGSTSGRRIGVAAMDYYPARLSLWWLLYPFTLLLIPSFTQILLKYPHR